MINYEIKRANGKIYASIPNNLILGPNTPNQNPVPINLVGRNKVGYGQAYNENALWLAENFASQYAPKGNIAGQLWYKYTSGAGELLVALKDDAAQPVDAQTELEWGAIPTITVFNTVPDGTNSIMGRMVLTNNGDRLMVLMKDKEWREIQTTRPSNKQYERLLDINYDSGAKFISYTQTTSTKTVSYFNVGGAPLVDSNGFTVFQDGDGVFNFGANYFFEMNIIARQVTNTGTTVVPMPTNYKTWQIKGQFYVDNAGNFTPGVTVASALPDPRKVSNLTQIKDEITSTQNTWDVNVVINGVDPSVPGANGNTGADYENYVLGSLNSSKHLGIRVDGTVSGLGAGQSTLTQWSVLLKITGVPPVGV